MTDGRDAKIFRISKRRKAIFRNANEDRRIIIAVCVSILSYRDIVVPRALYPFKSKVALLAQIFTLNELIDGRTTAAPWMFGKRWEDDNIFILYISVCTCI